MRPQVPLPRWDRPALRAQRSERPYRTSGAYDLRDPGFSSIRASASDFVPITSFSRRKRNASPARDFGHSQRPEKMPLALTVAETLFERFACDFECRVHDVLDRGLLLVLWDVNPKLDDIERGLVRGATAQPAVDFD